MEAKEAAETEEALSEERRTAKAAVAELAELRSELAAIQRAEAPSPPRRTTADARCRTPLPPPPLVLCAAHARVEVTSVSA